MSPVKDDELDKLDASLRSETSVAESVDVSHSQDLALPGDETLVAVVGNDEQLISNATSGLLPAPSVASRLCQTSSPSTRGHPKVIATAEESACVTAKSHESDDIASESSASLDDIFARYSSDDAEKIALDSITARNWRDSPLLRLPREIRHEIWAYVVTSEWPIAIHMKSRPDAEPEQLSLCHWPLDDKKVPQLSTLLNIKPPNSRLLVTYVQTIPGLGLNEGLVPEQVKFKGLFEVLSICTAVFKEAQRLIFSSNIWAVENAAALGCLEGRTLFWNIKKRVDLLSHIKHLMIASWNLQDYMLRLLFQDCPHLQRLTVIASEWWQWKSLENLKDRTELMTQIRRELENCPSLNGRPFDIVVCDVVAKVCKQPEQK